MEVFWPSIFQPWESRTKPWFLGGELKASRSKRSTTFLLIKQQSPKREGEWLNKFSIFWERRSTGLRQAPSNVGNFFLWFHWNHFFVSLGFPQNCLKLKSYLLSSLNEQLPMIEYFITFEFINGFYFLFLVKILLHSQYLKYSRNCWPDQPKYGVKWSLRLSLNSTQDLLLDGIKSGRWRSSSPATHS